MIFGNDSTVLARLEPEHALPSQRAAWVVPHPWSATWTPEQYREAQTAFPVILEAIRILHRGGVLVTVGTDLMNPWMTAGVSFHRELQLLAQAGIPNAEVLQIANPERCGGARDSFGTGTVEPGKLADLVVLGANPLQDIRVSRQIERVFLKGLELDPAQLRTRAGWH